MYPLLHGNAIIITYFECVFVALRVLPAMRISHIVVCGLCGSTILFHIISQKASLKKVIEHNGCFAFSINMPLVLRRTERDVIINVYSSSCKVPSYSFQFLFKQKFFSTYFFKNTQISNNIKICPVGAELIRADGRTDGRTDMTKLIVAFRNFANAPKSSTFFAHRVFMYFVWISEHTAISSN